MTDNNGVLYLLPTLIGGSDFAASLPQSTIDVIYSLDTFVVENEKTARRFLKTINYPKPQNDIKFYLLNEHTSFEDAYSFFSEIKKGEKIGLMSEAGCPCIADPGNIIVNMAHQKNFKVIPMVGPSSILLALMVSGFNGQNFAFNGYIPIDNKEKLKKIKEMERNILANDQTQIFMETPYRNMSMLKDLVRICRDDLMLCIAANLNAENEMIIVKPVRYFKSKLPNIDKIPAMFLLYK